MLQIFFCFMFMFSAGFAHAVIGDQSQTFTLEGELYSSPSGTSPFLGQATLQVRILDPSKTCVLYAEAQTIDTSTTNGVFNVEVGSTIADPDGKRSSGDSANSMAEVFQNLTPINSTGCGPFYTPAIGGGDGRYLEIAVTPTATGITDVLTPEIYIGSVPSAVSAQTLQGLSPANFALLKPGSTELTQANLEDIFSLTNFPLLQAAISGGGGGANSSLTDTTLNADSDANGTGALLLQTRGVTRAEVRNDGDFAVDSSTLYVEASSNKVGIGSTAPSFDLSFGGDTDRMLGLERSSSGTNVGHDLFIGAGGATSAVADKKGGDLYLSSGISTGSMGSSIFFQTATPGSAGSADHAPTTKVSVLGSGNVGIGTATPSALVHLKAGSAAANSAPLKFTAGVNLTTPEPGAVEFDGTSLFYTDSTNARKTLATTAGGSFSDVTSIANSTGNISVSAQSSTGQVLVTSGTPSTSATSGALVITGGVGITGNTSTLR